MKASASSWPNVSTTPDDRSLRTEGSYLQKYLRPTPGVQDGPGSARSIHLSLPGAVVSAKGSEYEVFVEADLWWDQS